MQEEQPEVQATSEVSDSDLTAVRLPLMSLASGLVLAAVAIVGTGGLLQKQGGAQTSADAVFAIESMLAQQTASPSVSSENLDNYLGLGQPGEGSGSEPQFGTMADADFASR